MSQQNNNLTGNPQLSDAKRALLEKRLRGQLKGSTYADDIPLYEGTETIPLSFAQERLWFLHQLDPQSPAYNMHNVVRIQGELDKNILTESFRTLIQRHRILRTTFGTKDGYPHQKTSSEIHFEIQVIDLGIQAQGARSVEDLIKTEIRCPFDLVQGPLLRVVLVRQAEKDHILVLTIHHILFDEWSNELLWGELSTIYRALSDGEKPSLPDLPVQYTDFTVWQKQQIYRQKEEQLVYWRQQLEGELPFIELPVDYPRPAQQTFHGALQWRQLPGPLYAQLKSLNQELGTTMFMLLLSAFQLLLTRYTGQSDILVGAPIANRSRPETKGLIGLFLNTLVFRANLEKDVPFVEFASRTRQSALDAFKHQDLPFEILVDELHPRRVQSHNPLFQVMFVHQKSALDALDLPGLMISEVPVDPGVAKFDLTLFAQESNDILSIGLEYNINLFNSQTADRILGHYQTLLESILENPQKQISDLQILTSVERAFLLRDWNDTSAGSIPETSIHELIELQIARRPDDIAVVDRARQLTYRELDERANQLAHYLRRLGIGPDVPVGLLLERSTEMITAILAVLKAGGAYLPLDPDYPRERLALMIRNARAPVILTQEKYTDSMPGHEAKIIAIDLDWNDIAEESTSSPEKIGGPDNLAYIIYTSGSTGIPGGVPVSHRNLVHSTLARDYFYPGQVKSFLLLSSFTFDSSVAGIFWTLCQGGKLVLPPQRIEQDMTQLAEIIAHHRITHTLCLPTLYTLLLELADRARLSSLRAVIVAGEECQPGLVKRHFDNLPRVELYNEYGPTETTVWSTAYKITPDFKGNRVPIGRPIPNAQNYILDRYSQPAPIGVTGELCIGGPGLTAGYLNDPEKTSRKFIQASFPGEPPRRLYRTGDRARYLPDGNIEFLGRLDLQIKVRGNRVEMGEIESALQRLPDVREAVVDVIDNRLVAYIVLQIMQPSSIDWRAKLANSLPGYMIPSDFLVLEEFPRTPNGKLDRSALPSPNGRERRDEFVAPRSKTELALAEIWKGILHLDHVSINDSFFNIGGNSILSIRIFARIADQFNVDLPLSLLFTETTIVRLAARIDEQKQTNKTWPVLVPIRPMGSGRPFFFVHGVGGGVLGYRDLVNFLDDDHPFLGLQAVGQDGRVEYDRSIEVMASRYIQAMRSVQPNGPYQFGGYCFGGVVAYEMACQLEEMGESVSLLAIFEGAMPDTMDTRVSLFGRLSAIWKSIPSWIKDYSNMSPRQLVNRIRSTLIKVYSKLQRDPELDRRVRVEETLDIDPDNLPKRNIELTDVHLNAALEYTPGKYRGIVTLFRARNRSFNEVIFGSLDPKMGWGPLAKGGVDVRLVDGFHRNMHLAPYASSLAAELSKCLDSSVDN